MHSETHSLANEHNFKVIACRHLLLQLQQHCFDSTTVFFYFVLYVHLIKSNNIIQTHYKNRELLKRRMEYKKNNNIKKKNQKQNVE